MNASWLTIISVMSLWTLSAPVSGNMENKLINDLLKIYSKYARPLINSNDILNVTLSEMPLAGEINEQSHILTAISYETLRWKDEILVWDPALYGGISNIYIDSNYIWIPDITLYTAAIDVDVKHGQGNAVINSEGNVIFVRTSQAKVKCDFDSLKFPFDKVKCRLTYGSWVYSGNQLNLMLKEKPNYVEKYEGDPMWDLKNTNAERKRKFYPCCPEPYDSVEYVKEFRRRSSQYVHIVLVPLFLLSVLTILLFMLPTHSSERVTLGILLFCAFFTTLLYTSSLIPEWKNLPYLVMYLIFNLVLITVFTFLNSLIIRLSNSERGREVPKILRAIMFEFFARIFCMKSVVNRNRSRHLVAPEYEFHANQDNYYKLSMSNEKEPLDPTSKEDPIDNFPDVPLPQNGKQSFETDVAFIRAFTRRSWQKMKNGDWETKLFREWKDVAKVANRLFFLIYLPVVLIAIGIVFIQISEN